MHVGRSNRIKVKPVHVALLVASALYLIAGTAGAAQRPLNVHREIALPTILPEPPKLLVPSMVEILLRESNTAQLFAQRNSEANPARTWYVPLVFAQF